MSKVIVNEKYLKSKTKKDMLIGILFFILGIILEVIISDFGKQPNIYMLLPLVFLLMPGIYFIHTFNNELKEIKKDNSTLKDLSMLPQKYTVLQNVYLPYNKNIIHCHFVVVGENGVFVVEANGKKGDIYESKDKKYWLVYGIMKKTKTFVKPLENQKNVVDAKVIALAEYLNKYNVNTWIQGISYFADRKAKLHILNYKGVFDNPKDLIDYIVNYPTKSEINDLKKEKIERLLSLDTLKLKK